MTDDPQRAFRAAIVATLGANAVPPDVIEPGRFWRFSTSERRGDDAGWCKLFNDFRGGVFGCYRQGISETWSAANRATMTRQQRLALARQVAQAAAEREAQQRAQWSENARRNAQLWAKCVPLVPGDACALYLEQRGVGDVWPLTACLRLHRGLSYWHGGNKLGSFPAMVAPVTSPDGRVVALHRTYLMLNGRKADVPTVKKLTGAAGPMAGACIALHKPVRGVIGIAEGIETALAAWCASGVPTVAAYCASNLAAWRWPPSLQRLLIFADADKAGQEAADALRARAVAAHLRCDVLAPTEAGTDWCDAWAQSQALTVAA